MKKQYNKDKNGNLGKIKDYYERTLKLLNKNKRTEAIEILYVETPIELYDLSLDILYNRNKHIRVKKSLLSLISEVDGIINKEEEVTDLELEEDIFQGDIF